MRIANAIARLEDHPWPAMAAAGLHLTLNSDDPSFIESNLGEEYALFAAAMGYDFDTMTTIALDGVAATWLPDDERARLAERVRTEAAELKAALAEGTAPA